jgi:protein CWC15
MDLDLIFKNQAVNSDKPSGQFVNDLLRTEFHR